jgi:F0F1-type ATP synthase assembly protein I
MSEQHPAADESEPEGAGRRPKLSPEQQARADAEALRLGRHLPLGMVAGAAVGLLAGTLTHRYGICVPVGIAAGILLAGTLPVFLRRH